MYKSLSWFTITAALLPFVRSQSPIYGQCGGQGWTGPTTCASGSTCVYSNPYYSQCVPGSSGGGGSTTSSTATTTTSKPQSTTFTQPVIYEDLADVDILRVNNTYYYSASTMHYSPGAPILQSNDLVNWEFVGHSVPTLSWSQKYDLIGGSAYVKGIWASTLRYRQSNGLFYWAGCIEFSKSYIYTAPSITGPWTQRSTINNCWYDCGMLIDDDDTMYVAYGNTNIFVAQLSSDGLSQVKTQQVYSVPSSIGALEGNRMYKRNGNYYIFSDKSTVGEYVFMSTSGPFGPYTIKNLMTNAGNPVSGASAPSQGGIVETQNGDWYYMSFVWAYPGGRVPVLAPITWGSDGWPVLSTVNGVWGSSYPYPLPPSPKPALTGTETFSSSTLGPQWEWNHNPDTTKYTVGSGLKLSTATVTSDLYMARNTLTHRILGPTSTATIIMNYSAMKAGDRAGLVILRDTSAWVGIVNNGGAFSIATATGMSMDSNWNTLSTGSITTAGSISGGQVWLRAAADVHSGTGKQVKFSYSTNGNTFTSIGQPFTLNNTWQFFMAHRFGIFNYATQSLGGTVSVSSFALTQP